MTASLPGLYCVGVTVMQSCHSVPTSNLGGGGRNHFHRQWFEEKLQLPDTQKVSLLFWKGVGDFVLGGKCRDGPADVSGLRSFTTVGTGQCCGDRGWKPLGVCVCVCVYVCPWQTGCHQSTVNAGWPRLHYLSAEYHYRCPQILHVSFTSEEGNVLGCPTDIHHHNL